MGDISCDIHVCSRFLGGHARKYFDLLWRFSQMEEQYSENLPAFVSKLNKENGSKCIIGTDFGDWQFGDSICIKRTGSKSAE